MNIFPLLDYRSVSFKQDLIHFLTPQQKKILTVVGVIFGCLAIAYAMSRCCLKAKIESQNQEASEPVDPHKETLKIVSFLTEDLIRYLELKKIQALSAKCFINMQFEHGAIKKEFIIQNPTKAPFSQDFISQQAAKIKTHIDSEIKEDLGLFRKIEVMTILKDNQNRFHSLSNDYAYNRNTSFISLGGSTVNENLGKKGIAIAYKWVIDEMGFPKEQQMENGEFVPGSLYQDLE